MAKDPEEYAKLLLDPRWQQVRMQVLFRDKYACQECGRQGTYPDLPGYKRGITMHVHHAKYIGYNPWDTPKQFLKTVCDDCHSVEHSGENMQDFFKPIIEGSKENGHTNICPIEHTNGHTNDKEAV